jgi:hypothetical protein
MFPAYETRTLYLGFIAVLRTTRSAESGDVFSLSPLMPCASTFKPFSMLMRVLSLIDLPYHQRPFNVALSPLQYLTRTSSFP